MTNKPMVRGKDGGRQAQVLVAGGVIGALVGLGAAYLLWQARERRVQDTDEDVPIVTSSGLMRIGVLVFGLIRQIMDIGRGE